MGALEVVLFNAIFKKKKKKGIYTFYDKWDEDQLASVPFPNCIFSGCQLLIGCVCVLRAVVVQVNTPTSSAVRAADTLPVRSAEQVQRLSSCSGGWTTPRGAAASDREGAWSGRRVHMC